MHWGVVGKGREGDSGVPYSRENGLVLKSRVCFRSSTFSRENEASSAIYVAMLGSSDGACVLMRKGAADSVGTVRGGLSLLDLTCPFTKGRHIFYFFVNTPGIISKLQPEC